MKKIAQIILMCIVLGTSLTCFNAAGQDTPVQSGFGINFNGAPTGYTSVIRDDKHFLPMRKVFELMEGIVFYRDRDSKILVLSRNGDIITHIIGDKTITVNGEEKIFENQSFTLNNETYISVDMISAALCPDCIFYHNRELNIEKQMLSNEYHIFIKDVLDLARNSNFYPERFQRYINYHVKNPGFSFWFWSISIINCRHSLISITLLI